MVIYMEVTACKGVDMTYGGGDVQVSGYIYGSYGVQGSGYDGESL